MVPERPNLFVLCMHKAASTFVADVLLPSIAVRTAQYDLFNVGSMVIRLREQAQRETGAAPAWDQLNEHDKLVHCLDQRPLPVSNGLIGRLYPGHLPAIEQATGWRLPTADHRLVVVRRDPRDALVSLYYSLRDSHDPRRIEGNTRVYSEARESLQGQDVCRGIKSLLQQDGMNITTREFLACTRLIESNPDICDLPYELLLNQPATWLARFVTFGQLEEFVDRQWLAEMVEHLRPPVNDDPTRHKRRMRPGNWTEVFDDEMRQVVDNRIGPQMKRFGYVW